MNSYSIKILVIQLVIHIVLLLSVSAVFAAAPGNIISEEKVLSVFINPVLETDRVTENLAVNHHSSQDSQFQTLRGRTHGGSIQ